MGRSPCSEEAAGVKKGPWTAEEDKKLADHIRQHGLASWRALPKLAGLNRCSKSCRLRWTNYLRPDIRRGNFSADEERLIIHLHSLLGNKWSAMAARLPGRTDNEIKNYWNTHLKKKLLRAGIDPVTHRPRADLALLGEILGRAKTSGPGTGGGPAAAVRLLREVIRAILDAAPSNIELAEAVSSALLPGSGAPPPLPPSIDRQLCGPLDGAAAAFGSLFFPDYGQPCGRGRAAPFEGEETFPSPSSEVVPAPLEDDVHIDFNRSVDHPPPRSCRYSAASTPSLASSSSSSSATAMDQLQEMINAGDAPEVPLAPWMDDLPDADSDFYWKDMLDQTSLQGWPAMS